MSEETIIKLLKSSNIEDKLLGVTLAVDVLGQEWCRKAFKTQDYIANRRKDELYELLYDDFTILMGYYYIQYVPQTQDKPSNNFIKIINNKTNVKELSK